MRIAPICGTVPRWLLLAVLLCVVLSGCSSNGKDNAAVLAPAAPNEVAPAELDAALPALPLDDKHASVTGLTLPGKDFYDSSAGVQISGDRLILASSAGVMRWAIYRFSSTEIAQYPVELRVDVGDDSDQYWLAMGDYTRSAWQFSGPFTDYGTFAVPPGHDFLSPQGYAYAAVITFDGARSVVDELELVMSQYPPPPAPTGLSATVLAGSVRLEWDSVDTPGLIGYNVYYALSSFAVAEEFHVSKVNLSLVPDSAEPQLNLTELSADTNYVFRVAAVVGDQVESKLSNQVTINTSYTLTAGDVFPQRQYPGFWAYIEGEGFDPAPGATTVSLNNSPVPAGTVKVVDGKQLRFRVPLDTVPGVTYHLRVHTGSLTSNTLPLFVTESSIAPKAWAHVGRVLYQTYEMYEPLGVAVDPAGHIWVANAQARRVDGFNANGSVYKSVFMNDIRDIEALSDGRIVCKESNGPQLWVYDPQDGSIAAAIDSSVVDPVLGSGEFFAVSSSGILYLSDEENGLIHKFIAGAFDSSIGAGVLAGPRDVELDGSGNLVVADAELGKVFWFSPSGTKLDEYNGSIDDETDEGELHDPVGLTVAGSMVYVCDRQRDRILRLNGANGAFVSEWGESGFQNGESTGMPATSGPGYFWSIWGLAANSDGNLIVSDNFNMRVGVYRAADGMFLSGLGDYVPDPGNFVYPRGLSVRESDGAYAVLDRATYILTQYDRENQLIDTAYLETTGGDEGDIFTGRMGRHGESICWSSNGRLYFTHAYNKLTEYSEDFESYRLLAYDWGEEPSEFKGAYSLCEHNGYLYVSDRENARIQVFNGLGQYERSVLMPNQLEQRPDRIAYDSNSGNLYVLDRSWSEQSVVHRFNAQTGAYIDTFDPGYTLGAALAVDAIGHLYVYHNAAGFLLERWAPPATAGGAYTLVDRLLSWGDGDGEVRDISWLTISSDGRYFICDRERQQIVILAP